MTNLDSILKSRDITLPTREMVTHSSILAWKSPWTEEPVGYSTWDHKELDTTE